MSDNLNSIGIRGKIAARMPDYRYTLPEGGNPGDIPVKTENGVEWQHPEPATTTPDYNQNDETASDYIKNRPGGYTVDYPAINIEWDGVIGDRVVVVAENSIKLVKVSDEVLTMEQLIGATVTYISKGNSGSALIDSGYGINENNYMIVSELFVIVKKSNSGVSETGIYFTYVDDNTRCISLSIPAKTTIVPIPGELTNIVGGYVRAEKKEPLVDAVIPAGSFELYTGGK